MTIQKRDYARKNDIGPEGQILFSPGDKMGREESATLNIKDWVSDLDEKVDKLISDGCSHRGNDLAKLARIEIVAEGFRSEAGEIKNSVFQLALSFESHKTDVVRANGLSDGKISELKIGVDNKINNLKIGVLIQCLLLAGCLILFVVKEFVLPAIKNPSSISSVQERNVPNEDGNRRWDGRK